MISSQTKIKDKILVVAPHQDDEVIGCGATMALLISKGYEVFVVHVFKGSSDVLGKGASQTHIIRHKEAYDASEILKFNFFG